MPVVSPPNATVPKTTLVAMSCCSGVRDLYQSETLSSAGVTFSSRVVPSSSAFSLKGMAASPASAIFWFSSACASRVSSIVLLVSWYVSPMLP